MEMNGALLINNGTVSGDTRINFGSRLQGAGTFTLAQTGNTVQLGYTGAVFVIPEANVGLLALLILPALVLTRRYGRLQ